MMDGFFGRIPFVYFDWYARMLPGIVALVYYFHINPPSPDISNISASSLFVYAVISYTAGHIIQPFSSFIVKLYINFFYKKSELKYRGIESHDTMEKAYVEKAYAEAVGMFSTFILLIIVSAYKSYKELLIPCNWCQLLGVVILYFFLATAERVCARNKKICNMHIKKLNSTTQLRQINRYK